jgi:acetolactate synthase-1/2/3 large subunit
MLDRAEVLIKDRLALSTTGNPAALVDKFLDVPLQSDSAYTINSSRTEWNKTVDQALHHRQLARQDADSLISKQIVETVERVLGQYPSTIVVCDGGEFGQWAQGFTHPINRLTNGPSGAIGASLPYAIGAKIACPDAPVIAIMGDGTSGFHLAEFETAARQELAITVLIGNDSRWNAEHLIQVTRYGVDRARDCELSEDVHYETVAQGLGCEGTLISELSELPGILSDSLQSPTTTCINVLMPGAAAPQYTALNLINTHH